MGGRPKIRIPWHDLKQLIEQGITILEIANYYECSHDTIERLIKQYTGKTYRQYCREDIPEVFGYGVVSDLVSEMGGSVGMRLIAGFGMVQH